MTEGGDLDPWGAKVLTFSEAGELLGSLIALNDRLAQANVQFDKGAAEGYRVQAGKLRELRWSIHSEDRIWLLTEPASTPEFEQGSVYVVVIREGTVIAKLHLVSA